MSKYGVLAARGTQALKNISLNIPMGMFGLLGSNGAGKSSLMPSYNHQLRLLLGKTRACLRPRLLAPLHRKHRRPNSH